MPPAAAASLALLLASDFVRAVAAGRQVRGADGSRAWARRSDLTHDPLHPLLRPVEAGGRVDLDRDVELALESGNLLPAPVLEGVRELRVEPDADDLETAVRRSRLDAPQEPQADEFGRGDGSRAGARRARPVGPQHESLFDALTVDLQQAVGADAADGGARLVGLHGVAHRLLDGVLVLAGPHVDEVDDDEAADVTKPQLPRDLRRGLEVDRVDALLV